MNEKNQCKNDAMSDSIKDDKAVEQYEAEMQTIKQLENLGWKIKAKPDDIANQEITILKRGTEEIVLYQNVTQARKEEIKRIVTVSNKHPVTGTTTPDEAKDLLFNATRSK